MRMRRRRIGSILLSGCNWYDVITSFDLFREFAALTRDMIDASGWKPSC